jgi:hypothetical protein
MQYTAFQLVSGSLRGSFIFRIEVYSRWITDKPIEAVNVKHLAACGRLRWKIESEHTNVLKHQGYNLEHTIRHGKNHAGENFCLLNLLAFLFHTIILFVWGDEPDG